MKEKLQVQVAKNSLKLRLTELHLLKLFKEGHINGTVHTSIGQEVIPVILKLFTSEDDWCFSNHRGHSHYLARTNDFETSGIFKKRLEVLKAGGSHETSHFKE